MNIKKEEKISLRFAKIKEHIFLIIFIISILLLSLFIYKNNKENHLNTSENAFYERNVALESSIDKSIKFVLEMKSIIDLYINDPISDENYTQYLDSLEEMAIFNKEKNIMY